MSTNDTQVQQPSNTNTPKSAAALVGLILGIVALLTSLVPIVNNMSFVFALIGVVFAVVGLVGALRGKKSGKGIAIAATVVNVLAMVLVLASQSAYSNAIDNAVVDTEDGTVASASSDDAASATDATSGSDAASSSAGDSATGDSSSAQDNASKYTITDEQLEKDSYTCTISGAFTNTSGKELSYVGLTYNLFDANGNQIDNAYANTTHLADGASWKFEASSFGDPSEVASYALADVTAY